MTPDEIQERQQQIRRLHRKIREYKLTPQEQEVLERNKYELECMIQSKFSYSKSNNTYRFPGAELSERLGVREQIDLHRQNTDRLSASIKLNTMSYDTESKISFKEITPISFAEFSSQKERIMRQSHSPQFRPFTDSLSTQKRLTEAKQTKRNIKGKGYVNRMLTEMDNTANNHSQFEIEQLEPCAMKVPISICTIKKRAQDEQSNKNTTKKQPEMRLSTKDGESRAKLRGKQNQKKQIDISNVRGGLTGKGAGVASQFKRIVVGKSDEKRNDHCRSKAGLFLVDRALQKNTQPMTCKNRSTRSRNKFDSTRVEQSIHYLRPTDKMPSEQSLSKRSKSKNDNTKFVNKKSTSKSPNKLDLYAKMFQSIKVKNNASTASSTNQSSLTPMHSSIKESISKSTCRIPISIISPLNKGYLQEMKMLLTQKESDSNTQSLRLVKK